MDREKVAQLRLGDIIVGSIKGIDAMGYEKHENCVLLIVFSHKHSDIQTIVSVWPMSHLVAGAFGSNLIQINAEDINLERGNRLENKEQMLNPASFCTIDHTKVHKKIGALTEEKLKEVAKRAKIHFEPLSKLW